MAYYPMYRVHPRLIYDGLENALSHGTDLLEKEETPERK